MDTGDIAELKCRVKPTICSRSAVCAGVLISCLNRACLKGPPYSAPKHLYTCQYKPKGMELGGRFACSREGAGQETIVSFGKGEAQA